MNFLFNKPSGDWDFPIKQMHFPLKQVPQKIAGNFPMAPATFLPRDSGGAGEGQTVKGGVQHLAPLGAPFAAWRQRQRTTARRCCRECEKRPGNIGEFFSIFRRNEGFFQIFKGNMEERMT